MVIDFSRFGRRGLDWRDRSGIQCGHVWQPKKPGNVEKNRKRKWPSSKPELRHRRGPEWGYGSGGRTGRRRRAQRSKQLQPAPKWSLSYDEEAGARSQFPCLGVDSVVLKAHWQFRSLSATVLPTGSRLSTHPRPVLGLVRPC